MRVSLVFRQARFRASSDGQPGKRELIYTPILCVISSGGNTDVRIATPVPAVMAPPTPWRARKAMSHAPDREAAQRTDALALMMIPTLKTVFLPRMSVKRPNGTRNIATASRYPVATQLNVTASKENCVPMEGGAILTEEDRKGVRKELADAISSIAHLEVPGVAPVPLCEVR